jgi:hypothetical protein
MMPCVKYPKKYASSYCVLGKGGFTHCYSVGIGPSLSYGFLNLITLIMVGEKYELCNNPYFSVLLLFLFQSGVQMKTEPTGTASFMALNFPI